MRTDLKFIVFLLITAFFFQNVTAAENTSFSVEFSQDTAEIGDIVHIKSMIPMKNSGAVYLFMTGPGLPDEGVPIEGDIRHSRIPYDKVYISGSVFEKDWDTGLIIGGLDEGEYTLYISTKQQNALNPEKGTYAVAEIRISDTKNTEHKELPLHVYAVFISIFFAVIILRENRHK
ncbi:MAG: hypothetical protein PHV39_09655 [Methanomicrobium sp.]|nr:hypothetical protein [Methanomicrobium sp.]